MLLDLLISLFTFCVSFYFRFLTNLMLISVNMTVKIIKNYRKVIIDMIIQKYVCTKKCRRGNAKAVT